MNQPPKRLITLHVPSKRSATLHFPSKRSASRDLLSTGARRP